MDAGEMLRCLGASKALLLAVVAVAGLMFMLKRMFRAALGILIVAVVAPVSLAKFTPPLFALIVALPPGGALGGMFAFYKKEDLPLLTYLRYKRAFKKKSKFLVNDLAYGKDFDGQMTLE